MSDSIVPLGLFGAASIFTIASYSFKLIDQLRAESLAAELAPPVEDDPFRPIVIVGPSGVGKSTLIKGFCSRHPRAFGFSCSTTTRGQRPSETPGVHYHFESVEQFEKDVKEGKFLEYANYSGNWYGTALEELRKIRRNSQICVLDIDMQGVLQVKESIIQPYYVFLYCRDMEVLRHRLTSRGDTSEGDIEKRLATAEKELEYVDKVGFWDLRIESTTVEETLDAFLTWLHKNYPHLNDEGSVEL